MPFIESCRNVRLSDSILHAECRKGDGSYKFSVFPLDIVLGNVNGRFIWGSKDFRQSARNLGLKDSILTAELQSAARTWCSAEFDLDDYIHNEDGVLRADHVPGIVALPEEAERIFLQQLTDSLRPNQGMSVAAAQFATGTLFHVRASNGGEGTVFKAWTTETTATIMHVVQSKGFAIQQMDADIAYGSYQGAGGSLNLVKAKESIFDLQVGVGLESGFSIKDGSLETRVAGCRITLGKRLSVSVFGDSFRIHFGRLLNV